MKYDPNNELTDEQLEELGKTDFDAVLDYLDSQAEYLKQFSKPLSSYHTKRFASVSAANQGKTISHEELKIADEIGKKNEQVVSDKIANKNWKAKEHEMLKNTGVKNVKTDRSQWFD